MKRKIETPSSMVHCRVGVRSLMRAEFDRLSHQVMEHAFACHNDLGRLCDEEVYEADLALRLETAGLGPIARQTPLTVRWRDFAKTYFVDLIVQEALVIELKAQAALTGEHESQLLNYLFLLNVSHGKLINFGARSVQYRTVNAVVPPADRHRLQVHSTRWEPATDRCRQVLEILTELLKAWGAFLDIRLYEEALIHFLGGPTGVLKPIPLTRDGFALGTKMLPALTPDIGLQVTALPPSAMKTYESQLRRFLALTPWKRLHWINLHHQDIDLITLTR